mgnify:CR=1 FL=1
MNDSRKTLIKVIHLYANLESDTNYGDLKIGDTLLFHFDVAGQTIEKTFTVAGIAYFPSTGLFYCTSKAINSKRINFRANTSFAK